MQIDRIILDLDDVLNSCTMFILHSMGCKVGSFEYDKYPIEAGYSLVKAWSILTGRPEVTGPMFWEWVGRSIWEQMPVSKQFWLIGAAANIVGRENVLIASSPTKSADCLFGKYQWIEKNCPNWIKRQYSITPRKHWLAKERVLLFDDCDENVDLFRSGGGEAVLVPRPWNSMNILSNKCNTYLCNVLKNLN